MVDNRFVIDNKSNSSKVYSVYQRFITSPAVEGFFFSMVCSTAFVGSIFHLWWDIGYKYRLDEIKTIHWFSDFNFFAIIMLVVAVYYSLRKLYYGREIKFDMALAILLQALILVAVLDYHRQNYSVLKWAWILPAAYIIGEAVAEAEPDRSDERIEKVFFCLAAGMFIASALEFYHNFTVEPILGWINTEKWGTIWFKEDYYVRTVFEFGYVLMSASCGYMLYKSYKEKSASLFIVTIIVNWYIQYCDIRTEGRENRLLLPLNIMLFFIMLIHDNYKGWNHKRKVAVILAIAILLSFVFIFVIAFKCNWFGLYDGYMSSNWSSTGGIFTNIRLKINYLAFQNMLQYPTEDWALYEMIPVGAGYRIGHSMMLEYGRIYGATIYGVLVLFRIIVIVRIVLLLRKKKNNDYTKYFLIAGYISIVAYNTNEPAPFFYKRFLLSGLLICGMIKAQVDME